jgi:DNA (cytosine-5)-methyltransferase 1
MATVRTPLAGRARGWTVSGKRMLDSFCHAGGAAKGYHDAGFEVTGVDIEPMPHYPYEFIQADALDVLADSAFLAQFDAIHASPPCQTFARVTAWRGDRDDHPDLLTPTLTLLAGVSQPWIVENVPEAAPLLRADYTLCGTHFELPVRRHRIFQAGNWTPPFELLTPCQCYRNPRLLPFMHKGERAYADAMGCTWMTKEEGRQAIPPAYTEHIGRQLLGVLAVTT